MRGPGWDDCRPWGDGGSGGVGGRRSVDLDRDWGPVAMSPGDRTGRRVSSYTQVSRTPLPQSLPFTGAEHRGVHRPTPYRLR